MICVIAECLDVFCGKNALSQYIILIKQTIVPRNIKLACRIWNIFYTL